MKMRNAEPLFFGVCIAFFAFMDYQAINQMGKRACRGNRKWLLAFCGPNSMRGAKCGTVLPLFETHRPPGGI